MVKVLSDPAGWWHSASDNFDEITTRCGEAAANELNEALLAGAAEAKVLKDESGAGGHHGYRSERGVLVGLEFVGQGSREDRPGGPHGPGARVGVSHDRDGPDAFRFGPGPVRSARTCGGVPMRSSPRCTGSIVTRADRAMVGSRSTNGPAERMSGDRTAQ